MYGDDYIIIISIIGTAAGHSLWYLPWTTSTPQNHPRKMHFRGQRRIGEEPPALALRAGNAGLETPAGRWAPELTCARACAGSCAFGAITPAPRGPEQCHGRKQGCCPCLQGDSCSAYPWENLLSVLSGRLTWFRAAVISDQVSVSPRRSCPRPPTKEPGPSGRSRRWSGDRGRGGDGWDTVLVTLFTSYQCLTSWKYSLRVPFKHKSGTITNTHALAEVSHCRGCGQLAPRPLLSLWEESFPLRQLRIVPAGRIRTGHLLPAIRAGVTRTRPVQGPPHRGGLLRAVSRNGGRRSDPTERGFVSHLAFRQAAPTVT